MIHNTNGWTSWTSRVTQANNYAVTEDYTRTNMTNAHKHTLWHLINAYHEEQERTDINFSLGQLSSVTPELRCHWLGNRKGSQTVKKSWHNSVSDSLWHHGIYCKSETLSLFKYRCSVESGEQSSPCNQGMLLTWPITAECCVSSQERCQLLALWHCWTSLHNRNSFQPLKLLLQQLPKVYFGKPAWSDHEEFRKNGLVKQIQKM